MNGAATAPKEPVIDEIVYARIAELEWLANQEEETEKGEEKADAATTQKKADLKSLKAFFDPNIYHLDTCNSVLENWIKRKEYRESGRSRFFYFDYHSEQCCEELVADAFFKKLGLPPYHKVRTSEEVASVNDGELIKVTLNYVRFGFVEIVRKVLEGDPHDFVSAVNVALQEKFFPLQEKVWAAVIAKKALLDRKTTAEERSEFNTNINWPHDANGFFDPRGTLIGAGYRHMPMSNARDRCVCRARTPCRAVYWSYQPWHDFAALKSLHDPSCDFAPAPVMTSVQSVANAAAVGEVTAGNSANNHANNMTARPNYSLMLARQRLIKLWEREAVDSKGSFHAPGCLYLARYYKRESEKFKGEEKAQLLQKAFGWMESVQKDCPTAYLRVVNAAMVEYKCCGVPALQARASKLWEDSNKRLESLKLEEFQRIQNLEAEVRKGNPKKNTKEFNELVSFAHADQALFGESIVAACEAIIRLHQANKLPAIEWSLFGPSVNEYFAAKCIEFAKAVDVSVYIEKLSQLCAESAEKRCQEIEEQNRAAAKAAGAVAAVAQGAAVATPQGAAAAAMLVASPSVTSAATPVSLAPPTTVLTISVISPPPASPPPASVASSYSIAHAALEAPRSASAGSSAANYASRSLAVVSISGGADLPPVFESPIVVNAPASVNAAGTPAVVSSVIAISGSELNKLFEDTNVSAPVVEQFHVHLSFP